MLLHHKDGIAHRKDWWDLLSENQDRIVSPFFSNNWTSCFFSDWATGSSVLSKIIYGQPLVVANNKTRKFRWFNLVNGFIMDVTCLLSRCLHIAFKSKISDNVNTSTNSMKLPIIYIIFIWFRLTRKYKKCFQINSNIQSYATLLLFDGFSL